MNKNFDVNYSKYIQKLYRKQDTEISNDNNQVPHKYSVLEREDFTKYEELFKKIIINKDLKILDNENAPYKFLKHITNYNKFYTERQIKYINKTIELINKLKIHNNYVCRQNNKTFRYS